MFYFQHMLNKLVKLVHIDIGKICEVRLPSGIPLFKSGSVLLSRKRADIRGITSRHFLPISRIKLISLIFIRRIERRAM